MTIEDLMRKNPEMPILDPEEDTALLQFEDGYVPREEPDIQDYDYIQASWARAMMLA